VGPMVVIEVLRFASLSLTRAVPSMTTPLGMRSNASAPIRWEGFYVAVELRGGGLDLHRMEPASGAANFTSICTHRYGQIAVASCSG